LLDCVDSKIKGRYPANSVENVTIDGGSTHLSAILDEIPTGLASTRVQNTAIVQYDAKAERASAATTIRAIRNESATSTIIMGGPGLDVTETDQSILFIANPVLYRQLGGKGLKKAITIASGVLAQGGEEEVDVLAEGGVSDGMSVITGSQTGQTLTLRNGESSPGSVTISISTGGNIVLSASPYVLDDSNKALKIEFDGANWQEVLRY